jgi:acetylornithine deacetylase
MNIGTIHGGLKANIVPPLAQCEVMFRTVTPFASVFEAVEGIAAGRAVVELGSSNEPIRCRTISGLGRGEIVVRFGTDIPYLGAWGEPLLYGPGSIHHAHTDAEFILKQDVIESIDVYASMIKTLLAA